MVLDFSSHWHYVWLVAASLIAGVMNAMAGGGSFVSFPAMMAMGVLPVQANATNTVALWPGQLTSVAALREDVHIKLLPAVVTAAVFGGLTGAAVLLRTKQVTFLHQIPWLLLMGAVIFGVSGRISRWLWTRSSTPHVRHTPKMLPLFVTLFPIGFYIGYFGAGGGFLVMTVLALFGVEEMHTLNALKVVMACLSNMVAIGTFIVSGAVLWRYCVVSMVFAGLGGYVGAQYARRMNGDVLRAIVVTTGCVMAAYFFWRNG
ncbi:sulfite exporter TauE/SafE family protein [Edaphobacter bradus]|uniref:sulfite exporter TauE/SafE family protein n=1 Tax=Edaphobacter bradus TaxID=2259016 RepID=UPI0021E01F1B|nr:sulfite exporter TauE/SafE family protein [Edaphobacter bradus]